MQGPMVGRPAWCHIFSEKMFRLFHRTPFKTSLIGSAPSCVSVLHSDQSDQWDNFGSRNHTPDIRHDLLEGFIWSSFDRSIVQLNILRTNQSTDWYLSVNHWPSISITRLECFQSEFWKAWIMKPNHNFWLSVRPGARRFTSMSAGFMFVFTQQMKRLSSWP